MIITTLVTIVATFTLSAPVGIPLNTNAINEPNDLQPALGVNVYQNTANPQLNVRVSGAYQPALRVGQYQRTLNPQAQ